MDAPNIQGRSPHQISPHRGSLSLKSNVAVCCLPLLAIAMQVICKQKWLYLASYLKS